MHRSVSFATTVSLCAVTSLGHADVIDWDPFDPFFVPSGSWSDSLLWENDAQPGPFDVAAFPDYGDPYACIVDISPTVLGVFLTGPGATLDFNTGRTLTIADDPTDVDGFFVMQDGLTFLDSSTLRILDDVNGGGSIDLQGGEFVVRGTSNVDAPILVRNGGTFTILGTAGLTANAMHTRDIQNEGLFVMDSTSNGEAQLNGGELITLFNTATGELRLGNGGAALTRRIRTNVESMGTITVQPSTALRFEEAGSSIDWLGGTMTIGENASVVTSTVDIDYVLAGATIINDGLFEHAGNGIVTATAGQIIGNPLIARTTTIETGVAPTLDGQINVQGVSTHTGNVGPNMTLRLEGIPGLSVDLNGSGMLVEGRLILDSTSNGEAVYDAPGFLLDNVGIVDLLGGGAAKARRLRCDVLNRGMFYVAPTADGFLNQLGAVYENQADFVIDVDGEILNSSVANHFVQSAGTLQNDGAFRWTNGSFDWLGGDLTGNPLELNSVDVTIGDMSDGMGSLFTFGTFEFTGDIGVDQDVEVSGIPGLSATATQIGDTIVDGLLVMDSTSNGQVVYQGSTKTPPLLTISEIGELDLRGNGSAINRFLRLELLNLGITTVRDDADVFFDQAGRTMETDGMLVIEPDGELRNNSQETTFVGTGGTVDNQGSMFWVNGNIDWAAAELTGNPIVTQGTDHTFLPGSNGTVVFDAGGTASLDGDIAANQRMIVAGRPGLSATMNVLSNVDVDGRLEMTSSSNGTATVLSSGAGAELVTIRPGGVFEAQAGGTAIDRFMHADTRIEGSAIVRDGANLRVATNRDFTVDGSMTIEDGGSFIGSAGADFVLQSGAVDNAGTWSWNSGNWTLTSGALTGNPPDLVTLTVTTSAADAGVGGSLLVSGTSTLVGNVTRDLSISLQGRPGIASTLTVDEGMSIDGAVELTSTSNGSATIQTFFVATDPLIVNGTVRAIVGGTNQNRGISNTPVLNQGLMEIESGVLFTMNQPLDVAGLLQVDGTMRKLGVTEVLDVLAAGRLEGTGLIEAGWNLVLNDGTTSPAGLGTFGQLDVQADWEQTTGGTLEIELGDGVSDVLAMGDDAFLGGTLDLRLEAGFEPVVGTEWEILTADEVVGTFDNVTCAAIFQLSYLTDRVVVTVIDAPVFGDLNCDGLVNFNDLLIVLAEWGDCPGCLSDLDGDGVTGFADLLILLSNWT